MATEDAVIVRLGLTPEQLVGYSYAGLLSTFIATLLEPDAVSRIVMALGGVLSGLVALALGVGIYVLYFKILGEFVLYPLQHLVHLALDRLRGKVGSHVTSCVRYLGGLGVPVGQRRAAYEALKASFYPEPLRRRIQLAHGELHVLYLTAVECSAAALYLQMSGRQAQIWWVVAASVYFAALVGDLRQHTLECHMLKSRRQPEVNKFLTDGGYARTA